MTATWRLKEAARCNIAKTRVVPGRVAAAGRCPGRSGGFFLHLGLGSRAAAHPARADPGRALLIAAALIILAIGLITHG